MSITGKRRPAEGAAVAQDVPLIIAVHGGTYTSEYFDIPGHSLLDHAAGLGIPIVAIDRPGYRGSTPVGASDSIILKNAEVLDQVIAELWEAWGQGTSGVFLIGHSIGGAVVTAIAAGNPSWPLLGIAISGCLLEVPAAAREGFNALPNIVMIDLPTPMKDGVMFGPAVRLDYKHAKSTVATFRRAGVVILAGTDSNDDLTAPCQIAHGESLHEELERMVDAGLAPAEALRGATSLAADTFGLTDRGVIAPGRRADLVLVDGDPTRDISATRNIRGVWIGGCRVK